MPTLRESLTSTLVIIIASAIINAIISSYISFIVSYFIVAIEVLVCPPPSLVLTNINLLISKVNPFGSKSAMLRRVSIE